MLLWSLAVPPLTAEQRYLVRRAQAAGVSPAVVLEVAYEETRRNANPRVRGQQGEWGRFQIKLSTARVRCRGLDVRRYGHNVTCFVTMLARDKLRCGGYTCAVTRHNGSGPAARAFAQRVMARVGERILQRGKGWLVY